MLALLGLTELEMVEMVLSLDAVHLPFSFEVKKPISSKQLASDAVGVGMQMSKKET